MRRLEGLETLIRTGTRRPLWADTETMQAADLRGDALLRLLPHRDPFLFVERITGVDLAQGRIRGERRLTADDPVFAGHFPGRPIYPGALQLETIGQLGLCLLGLRDDGPSSGGVRATRVHHACFLSELGPGQRLDIVASLVREDSLTAVCAGQILRDDAVCAFAVLEVCLVAA